MFIIPRYGLELTTQSSSRWFGVEAQKWGGVRGGGAATYRRYLGRYPVPNREGSEIVRILQEMLLVAFWSAPETGQSPRTATLKQSEPDALNFHSLCSSLNLASFPCGTLRYS